MITHIIHCNTGDYCAVETTNFLECIFKMSNAGRTMVENIVDYEGGIEKYLLCFTKGDLLSKLI